MMARSGGQLTCRRSKGFIPFAEIGLRQMARQKLQTMTVEQLVALFESIGVDQDRAELEGDTRRYNSLFDRMKEVVEELRSRPGDERRALIPLLAHKNAQVKLKAAIATLAIVPEEARRTLEIVEQSAIYPQAANAGFMLSGLKDGSYIPS